MHQASYRATKGMCEIVDARPPARFNGEAPEPYAGLRGGNMKGSKNIAYAAVL